MKKRTKYLFLSLMLMFFMFLMSACATSYDVKTYPAWGICDGGDDPINTCKWLHDLVERNKYSGNLIIAEIIAKKYIIINRDEESKELIEEDTQDYFFGYKVYCEHKKVVYDEYLTTTYDCSGLECLPTGDAYGWDSDFLYIVETDSGEIHYHYSDVEYNVIYRRHKNENQFD